MCWLFWIRMENLLSDSTFSKRFKEVSCNENTRKPQLGNENDNINCLLSSTDQRKKVEYRYFIFPNEKFGIPICD